MLVSKTMSHPPALRKPKPQYDPAAQQGLVERDPQVILNDLLQKINQPAAVPSVSALAAQGSPLADFEDAAYPVLSDDAASQAARIGSFLVLGNGQKARKAPAASPLLRKRFAKPRSKLLTRLQMNARTGYKSMTPAQKTAVRKYTGKDYSAMNAYLRDGDLFKRGFMTNGGQQEVLSEEQKTRIPGYVQSLHDGLRGLKPNLPEGLILSRNLVLPAAVAASLVEARSLVLQESAFLSTSLNPTVFDHETEKADEQKIQFRLDVGPGVKGLYMGIGSKSATQSISRVPTESEVLLPPNTRLHIVKVHRVNGSGYDPNGFGTTSPEGVIVVRARVLPSV